MKAIIFDFDGVIHDTLELGYLVYKQLYADASLEEYKNTFNGNIYKSEKITPEIAELYFEFSGPEYAKLELGNHIKEELLKLKEKYSLFVISSNAEKILKAYFEKNHSSQIFIDILGMETHTSKVEKFKILMKKYDLTTADFVFVTDTLGDLLEAQKLQLQTIAVEFGFHDGEKLRQGHPTKIVSKFEDILPAVEEIEKERTRNSI